MTLILLVLLFLGGGGSGDALMSPRVGVSIEVTNVRVVSLINDCNALCFGVAVSVRDRIFISSSIFTFYWWSYFTVTLRVQVSMEGTIVTVVGFINDYSVLCFNTLLSL